MFKTLTVICFFHKYWRIMKLNGKSLFGMKNANSWRSRSKRFTCEMNIFAIGINVLVKYENLTISMKRVWVGYFSKNVRKVSDA